MVMRIEIVRCLNSSLTLVAQRPLPYPPYVPTNPTINAGIRPGEASADLEPDLEANTELSFNPA